MKLDVSSLAHTKWECKYHVVFAPKYRRQVIYGKIKQDIGQMLRKLCEYKGVEIIEAEACKDHIHMLISIPPKYSVSQIMGYLKGKSSLMIYEKYANMKYKYGKPFLVSWILCEHCRTKSASDRTVYPESAAGGLCRRPDEYIGVYRPVYG